MEFLVLQHLLDKLPLVFIHPSLLESFQVFDLVLRGKTDSGVKALSGAIGRGKSVDEVEQGMITFHVVKQLRCDDPFTVPTSETSLAADDENDEG